MNLDWIWAIYLPLSERNVDSVITTTFPNVSHKSLP